MERWIGMTNGTATPEGCLNASFSLSMPVSGHSDAKRGERSISDALRRRLTQEFNGLSTFCFFLMDSFMTCKIYYCRGRGNKLLSHIVLVLKRSECLFLSRLLHISQRCRPLPFFVHFNSQVSRGRNHQQRSRARHHGTHIFADA